jgi:2-isopropylmalate synthase
LAAVQKGARQVECTVNGIGERAGNASLEELVMALQTRQDFFKGIKHGVKTRQIIKSSKMVSRLTSLVVQPNKAITGSNAFAHESGIHQDGMLKNRKTYEIINPSTIGLTESLMVLGKHSGKHAFRTRLKKLGFVLSEGSLQQAFEKFKVLADKKKMVYDEDIEAIADESTVSEELTYKLLYLTVTSSSKPGIATATIQLEREGKVLQDAATGDGPVDAIYKAIERLCDIKFKLLDYRLNSLTMGKDAMGEVYVRIQGPGRVEFAGRSTSTDILEASGKALLVALNKYFHRKHKKTSVSGSGPGL